MTIAAALVAAPLVIALVAAPAEPDPEVEFTFTDPEIVESSGLVMTDDLAVTVNDSGDSARIFTVDRRSGETVGMTYWEGEAVDIEALAPAGEGAVWVGDIGDNMGSRDVITVTKVPFGEGELRVVGESYDLVYPDGAHDAEGLAVDPATGRLHVISKDVFGGTIYRAPEQLDATGPNELEAVAEAPGIVTDAAWTPDGKRLLMRNYGRLFAHDATTFEELGAMNLPNQQQGESLAVDPSGEVFIGSEGAESDVLRIALTADLAGEESQEPTEDPSDSASAQPDGSADGGQEGADSTADDDPDIWPWVAGLGVGVVCLAVLIRSLRPR